MFKVNRRILNIFLFGAILFVSSFIAFGETTQSTHLRTSRLNQQLAIRFLDAPADMQFITSFPWKKLLEDPLVKNGGSSIVDQSYTHLDCLNDEGDTLTVDINWWIFTSVEYAEEKAMEWFCMCQLGYNNALDIGKTGYIGDNCFYGGSGNDFFDVCFIRNNVLVRISTFPYSMHPNQQQFIGFVRKVDQLLIESEKVTATSQIPAPMITNAEVIQKSTNSDLKVAVKINAYDPRGQKLWFVPLGYPISLPKSTDGIVDVLTPKVSGFSKTIIWVSNEDHIVSVLDKDFFPQTP